jgi:hypothetical protein
MNPDIFKKNQRLDREEVLNNDCRAWQKLNIMMEKAKHAKKEPFRSVKKVKGSKRIKSDRKYFEQASEFLLA